MSSPASVPSSSGCAHRSSARAIAGAEPISDWSTTTFCAATARRPNCAEQRIERLARVGAALAVREDVAQRPEGIAGLLEPELANVARDGRLGHNAPDARQGGDQLLLRPDPQPLDEARDELLTVGLAQLVLRLHGLSIPVHV